MANFLFLFCVLLLSTSGSAAPGKTDKESILKDYGKLPLLFIENKGQLDPKVRFYVKTSAQTLYFTDEGIVFDLLRGQEDAAANRSPGAEKGHQAREGKRERLVFNLRFENARKGVLIEGLERQTGEVNYFVGNDKSKWKTRIPTYKGIVYKDVYRRIDLKVFGEGEAIEYDFIVNPGGNPNDILLTYNGIEGLSINGEGELLISTAFGELRETKPYVYQEMEGKKVVDGSFDIQDTVGQSKTGSFSYGFQVASYNPSYPLVIDPTLSYSTYLGGNGDDIGYGITVDGLGNAYVTGYTDSTDFPVQNPFQGTVMEDNRYIFITKLSASGSALSYSTYLGGSESGTEAYAIAVDSSGNAYVTGETGADDFPTQNAFQASIAGRNDVFITKLSASGSALSYSTYLGGMETDMAHAIAVDSLGNAYVTGYTESRDFPTKNPYQGTQSLLVGGYDAFITKLSASGSALSYSTYLGGRRNDYGNGIAVDASGNAYITGLTSSSDFPTKNPFQAASADGLDAFITKLSASGSALSYSTYLGGSGWDEAHAIAVDVTGNAYVTGLTCSSDFPTRNPFQASIAGRNDAFITKLSASGSALSYSTYLGGSREEFFGGTGIAVDGLGNAYVTGVTDSEDFPTKYPIQETYPVYDNVFVTKLTSSGSALSYSTCLGGSDWEEAYSIAVDGSGNAYVTGTTVSDNFPTKNPFQGSIAGAADVFVTKFGIATSYIFVNIDGLCGGKTPCYTSIQTAVNAAETGAKIKIAQGTYTESITLNTAKAIILQGGWNTSYDKQTSNSTIIEAPKATKGSITLQMLTVKP